MNITYENDKQGLYIRSGDMKVQGNSENFTLSDPNQIYDQLDCIKILKASDLKANQNAFYVDQFRKRHPMKLSYNDDEDIMYILPADNTTVRIQ